ncbi:MAG: ABC transporter permease [Planctomycetia bacterium]|nr:ABC transporter permease [Planctomycetia bacterium]
MYKYLLCWRYLKTRYIALASVISVMLGVATMIVVNSVMAGFSDKMRDRLHGVLADVVVESYSLDGFYDSDEVLARINSVAGDDVEAMAATMEVYGLMMFQVGGQKWPRQVQIIGVEPLERAKTGDFAEFLFTGRKVRDPKTGKTVDEKISPPSFAVSEELRLNSSPAGDVLKGMSKDDPLYAQIERQVDEQAPDRGTVIGWALGTIHRPGGESGSGTDTFIAPPGTRVGLVFPKAGNRPEAAYDDFSVVGYFKSGMSEYDSSHVYVPLKRLQYMRLLIDEQGRGAVNAIQIKVKPGVNIDTLKEKVQTALERLRPMGFRVATWEDKQGPLLAAVAIEQSILNLLLFFIIAVAGFGILAIFFMIVVEKTRDIGIMKALGASTAGVRGIFLGYGLLLGMVGSGVGMAGGLLFVAHINRIEKWLSVVLGHKVFDDSVYYFSEIPTLVQPWTVFWIVLGALSIAAAASVWPAQRAAKLHPVKALRFE